MAEKLEKKISAEKLQEQLQEQQKEACEACGKEVEAVLVKHGCVLVAIPGLVPDGRDGWKVATRIDIQTKQQ